jgi:hypothetical protein
LRSVNLGSENYRVRSYTPRAGTHRSIGGKDDGVVPTISTSMRSAEEISLLTPNPHGGTHRSIGGKDDGGGGGIRRQ